MKILAIRGCNIASLEGKFEVDFTVEPLVSAGIFAITGATGAGKSSLLDTMCLALYGTTPRLQSARGNVSIVDVIENSRGESKQNVLQQGDARNLLRRGTSSGYAEVDFLSVDGNVYRSRWSVKRARNRIDGKLQNADVELYNLTADSAVSGTKSELLNRIIDLLGLTFHQFTRSILLAQGEFATFLKADQNEKSELLEKLTGTDIYSKISGLIYNHYANVKSDYDALAQKIGANELLDDEVRSGMEAELNGFIEQQAAQTQEKEQLSKLQEVINEVDSQHVQLQRLNTSLQEQHALIASHSARISHVQRLDLVEPAREDYNALTIASNQLKDSEAKAAETQANIETLQSKLTSLTTTFTQAGDAVVVLKQQHDLKAPEITKAQALDVQMETLSLDLKKEKEALDGTLAKAETARKEKTDQQTAIQKLHDNLKTVDAWIESYKEKEQVAANFEVISVLLRNATAAKKNSDAHLATKKEKEELLANTQASIALLEKEVGEQTTRIEEKEKTLAELNAQLAAFDSDAMSTKRDQLQLRADALLTLKSNVQLYAQQLKQRNEVQTKRTECEKAIAECRERIAAEEQEGVSLAAAKEKAEQIQQRMQLAISDNCETMRNTLAEGMPCPVCGSTEHPYRAGNVQLDEAMHTLEQEVTSARKTYEAWQIRMEGYKQRLAFNTNTLTQLPDVTQLDEALLQLENANNALLKTAQLAAVDTKAAAFADQLDVFIGQIKEALSSLAAQEQFVRKTQQQRDALQTEVKTMTSQSATSKSACDKAKLLSVSYSDEIGNLMVSVTKETAIYNENIDAVSQYFPNPEWIKNWNESASTFFTQLKHFVEKWKEATASSVQLKHEIEKQEETLKAKDNLLVHISEQLQQAETTYKQRVNDLEQLKKQRNVLLEGKAVEVVLEQMKKEAKDAQSQYESLQKQCNETDKALKLFSGIQSQLKQDQESLQKQIETKQQQLAAFTETASQTSNESFTLDAVLDLLRWNKAEADQERAFVKELFDKKSKLEIGYNERLQALNDYKARQRFTDKTDEEREALQLRNKELTELILTLTKQIDSTKTDLLQDEKNRKLNKELLEQRKQKQAVLDKWAKLNDLAGSADGKKFQRIAQQHTLDILLKYANVHLRILNKRYALERIPDTLALQIIDHDICDEKRSIHTLSGGETFLVSLGLALGLASLSSNRMKVESLFIDEGFGSLDSETLRVAMDALECLHAHGRKVGVISHVQEMTERIAVQIHIQKNMNGSSSIEIRG